MDLLLSVIIPVYKVEDVLSRCVDSIINQTYKKLEIILVDDGSPDNCGKICDNYRKLDSRIKVIHQSNGGLSDARNSGIKAANGDYIAFVDSDDYIVENTFEVLIKEAINHNLQVVAGNALIIKESVSNKPLMKEKKLNDEVITGIEYMLQSVKQNSFHVCAWLNIYKRDLLIEKNLFFKTGLLHEDEEWTPRVFIEASRVKYLDFKFYMYVIREDSIMTKKDKTKNGLDILETCYKLDEIYKNKLEQKEYKVMSGYLGGIFLGGIYVGRLDQVKYKKNVKKTFILGKVNCPKMLIKAMIFLLNIKLYVKVNDISKKSGWGI